MLLLILVTSLVAISRAQLENAGPDCPPVEPMHNYDASRLMGKWYEVARYPNILQINHKCSIDNFTLVNDHVKIYNRGLNKIAGSVTEWEGIGRSKSEQSLALFDIEFPKYAEKRQSTLTLIYSDYDNISIIQACQRVGVTSLTYLWILSRQQQLNPKYNSVIHDCLAANHLPQSPLAPVDQQNCPK